MTDHREPEYLPPADEGTGLPTPPSPGRMPPPHLPPPPNERDPPEDDEAGRDV
jgi:hypothetical protein